MKPDSVRVRDRYLPVTGDAVLARSLRPPEDWRRGACQGVNFPK